MRSTPILFLLALALAWPTAGQAQSSEEEDLGGIDAIIVTITKREESLSEVAATVSVFDASMIEQTDIQSISDVVTLIPNVQIKGDGDGSVSIRGVSQSFTSQAPVAMHMNGIWRQNSGNSFSGAFYDLSDIQVQRGPVGTVYGRNATAGAIDVSWKKPHDGWEVEGDTTFGNNSLYQTRAVVNVPFFGEGDERLMGRFAFQREVRDNYNDLVNRKSQDGGVDLWYLRGSLRSVLTQDLEITVRGSFSKDREAQAAQARPIKTNGQFAEGVFNLGVLGTHPLDPFNGYQKFLSSFANNPPGGFNTILTTLAQAANPGISREDAAFIVITQGNSGFGVPAIIPALDRNLPIGVAGEQQASNSAQDHADAGARASMADATVLWSLNDLPALGDIQVKGVGGWDRWRMTQLPEADGTQLVILDTRSFQQRKTWVGELNITSQNDDPYDWIAGFFYFDSEHETTNGTLTPFGLPPLGLSQTMNDTKGWAPFAQVNVRPLDFFSDDPILEAELWAGIRYNHDEAGVVTFNPSQAILMAGNSQTAGSESIFREVTYEFGLRVFPAEGHMVYAKWSKGYKPGFLEAIFDRGTQTGNPDVFINSVDPEVIRAWEFGWKGGWWDGRVQSALTYFRYSYSDLQVPKITASVVQTENAAAASNQGLELELRLQPTEEWSIQFAGGWLDATFDEFCSNDELDFGPGDPACLNPAVGGAGFLDLKDNDLEDSPHYNISLQSAYIVDLGELGTLTPSVSFTWTDDYFRRGFNRNDFDKVDDRTRTDLRLIWRSVDERYEMELFVQNLEDESVYARTIAVETPTAAVEFGLLPPRVFGVRFGYHWGDN